jgi:hypothetical protein
VALMENGTITRVPLLRIDRSGEIVDTLLWMGFPPRAVQITRDGNRFFVRPPFVDIPLVVRLRDGSGVAVVERRAASDVRAPSSFRLMRIDGSGDTVSSRDHAYRPIPVPAAVLEEAIATNIEQERRRGDPPGAREFERALREADLIPRTLPPVSEAISGGDGTLWLRRERTAEPEHVWNVFDPDGAMPGVVRLPRSVSLRDANGDLLVGVETDALDVPYVVVYRIQRPRSLQEFMD